MGTSSPRPLPIVLLALLALIGSAIACQRPAASGGNARPASGNPLDKPTLPPAASPTAHPFLPPGRDPDAPRYTPTPDQPHPLPTLRADPVQYVVQAGDSLGRIAGRYQVSVEQIAEANNLLNPNLLEVGQTLVIPVPAPQGASPAFKIIPDSELVYGPYSASFDIPAFIESQQGYLAQYQEEVDGVTLSGPQVVARVALENSVNPRLLLAVLQYRSKWLTRDVPREETLEFPLGLPDANRSGLYRQLFWAANELNRGYYLWRVNAIGYWLLADGAVIPAEPTVNAGTAGVQHLFALFYGVEDWQQAVGEQGLFAVYQDLFGYPFDYPYEPLLPADLTQPPMQLPFEPGKAWAFTGGPHGGWGDGAAWAAIDFAPPGEALGCVESDEWVVAVSDGLIVRAENGAVIQDVDGDGLEQTGWTILYMHIESRERVRPSAYLRAGERIGHPSCEGGFSTGTHLHLARRYNGEWIPADGPTPFVMDSWITAGAGIPYDGFLRRDGRSIEAWNGRSPENEIQR